MQSWRIMAGHRCQGPRSDDHGPNASRRIPYECHDSICSRAYRAGGSPTCRAKATLNVLTQAVLPQFRQRKSGVILNVTSSVTLKSLPLLSVYTASKAAVNAFTESLALELQQFNVRVRLVLPGRAPETDPYSPVHIAAGADAVALADSQRHSN